ncbi:hypothetical protein ACFL6U_01925 [Planctomycetota bacterium]
MKKRHDMPIWVFLAFASVETRRGALLLIGCNALLTLYCIPWPRYFQDMGWLAKVFMIDNWYWFAAMVGLTLWYVLSLVWLDRHNVWTEVCPSDEQQAA